MHEYRWGVLSCVVMLWYLQSFTCRIVTNLWQNCLTFYDWVKLCKHESSIEAVVDLSLNAGQSDPAYISCVATSGEVTERCVSKTPPRSLLLYSIHLCSPRIRAWRGAWFSVSANSLQAIWIKLSLTHFIGFARCVAGGQQVGFVEVSCVPRVRLRCSES